MCIRYAIYLRKAKVKKAKYYLRLLEKTRYVALFQRQCFYVFNRLITFKKSPESVSSFLAIENSSSSCRYCNACDAVSSEQTIFSWSSSLEMTFGFWPSLRLRSLGKTSSIASSRAFSLQSTKSVFIWPGDVITLSSHVMNSSTVMSSSSQNWLRRVANSSSILVSLQVLLAQDFLKPHFWKQWTIVSVETSSQATCIQ